MRDAPGQQLLISDADRRCYRCGRRLQDETSRQRGYGRTCWKRKQAEIIEPLRNAGLAAWDQVDDPEGLIRELRGD